jgi:regulator of ribosome biosynthesis
MAKNERQRLQNLARSQQGQAAGTSVRIHAERKREIDHTLATTRTSTASMGKFDRMLEGEKKLRGVKRKVVAFRLSFAGRLLTLRIFSFSSTQ